MALYQKINVIRGTICVKFSWFDEKVHDFVKFGGYAPILIGTMLIYVNIIFLVYI